MMPYKPYKRTDKLEINRDWAKKAPYSLDDRHIAYMQVYRAELHKGLREWWIEHAVKRNELPSVDAGKPRIKVKSETMRCI
jgi:hypothetical protein